ncbi:MAG: hypothetical protein OXH31_03775 [Gammaproteobacteria bacterium]|nr:hypothetical protein [Gammaproteobacteria bacterium]
MKTWLLIQSVIALGYFALTVLFWGAMAILFLPMVLVPLFIFFRLEHLANTNKLLGQIDLRLLTAFLIWIGVLLAVLPYVLSEIFWFAKELFFTPGRSNLFWMLGWVAFVVAGVQLAWTATLIPWTILKKRHNGLLTLTSSFNSVVNVSGRPFKLVGVAILAMFLALGLAFAIGTVLVWIGGYSTAEVFDYPSLTLQYQLTTAGFLLVLVPTYVLTHLWWRRELLAHALQANRL